MGVLVARTEAAETCLPDRAAYLGSDGIADFYRCDDCRCVFVRHGQRFWAVRTAISP